MSRLIVAIPALNEEKTIGGVVEKIRSCISEKIDCYILVVDDGSTDETVKVAKNAGTDIIVSHRSNQGVSLAYSSCIRYALEYNADIICTIDADAQFDPKEIEALVAPIISGRADFVVGSRFIARNSNHSVPILNRITNKLMAIFVSLLSGTKLHDVESGFRALTADAAQSLNLLGIGSFSHDMILDLTFKGYRVLEIPVSVRYYKDRISRVITGMMKYGFTSFLSIFLKTLAIRNVYMIPDRNQVLAEVVHISDRVQ